jgi:hypothetical protein
MRLPQMTTRRWMIAAAAIALLLGGYREAVRLKRCRAELLAKEAHHLAAETYYRGLIFSAQNAVLRDKTAVPETMTSAESSGAINLMGDRRTDLLEGAATPADEDAHERFRKAQARVDAVAEIRRRIMSRYRERQAEYHQRLVDHHAALARKYALAAARPWLSVAPDPPVPKQ